MKTKINYLRWLQFILCISIVLLLSNCTIIQKQKKGTVIVLSHNQTARGLDVLDIKFDNVIVKKTKPYETISLLQEVIKKSDSKKIPYF